MIRKVPIRRIGRLAAVMALALALGGCTSSSGEPTYPPLGVTPPPAGEATHATISAVLRALDARGLAAAVSTRPYRPPEAARLAAAPRTVVQATLPGDPERGLLVIYDLGAPSTATAAAEEQAAYIATGPGRIQFAPDARFVIRVSGSSVVFFTWSPAGATDPRTSDIAAALETVGTGVPVGS
jgi:hypothetical protein